MIDDQGHYFPSHLSPSQLALYRLCPVLYRERYVLKVFPPPQPERLFGIAVHAALEAQFRGGDDEQLFLRTWREHMATLNPELFPLLPALRGRGLEILELVRGLGLVGEPERHISVIAPDFTVPIIGYVDLWSARDGTVYDFKTAGFGWTQTQADRQLFQPAIYSQAYADECGELPKFKFVVLPRIPVPLQVLDASRSGQQVLDVFAEALRIHRAIEAQQWACACRGRYHLFEGGYVEEVEV